MNDHKIRNNVIWFLVTGAIFLIVMAIVSKSDIDQYTKLLTVVSIVCVSFFAGLYFAGRVFYLCFKKT